MNSKNSIERPLGSALLAAVTSVVGLAFIGGCLYGLWLGRGPVGTPLGVGPSVGQNIVDLLTFGGITALIAFPSASVLSLVVGVPLFRLWLRRGYSGIGAYLAGGLIVAMVGAVIIGAAHFFAGFQIETHFWFILLLVAVSGLTAGFVVWYVLWRSQVASSS
jgi:hypothetical protein